MNLRSERPIGFVPTLNAEVARDFYANVLGLTFVSDDHFALVFRVGPGDGMMLRIVRIQSYVPPPFTIFGWEVKNIHATILDLTQRGLAFLRFDPLEQDGDGVWASPDGSKVAWFKDPDGNTLSLSQHVDKV